MQIYVTMNPSKILGRLDVRDKNMAAAISKWQKEAGEAVLQEARNNIHSRSGKTAKSLRVENRGSIVRITSQSPVAVYLNDGTRPHTIRPVGKKALRFVVGGRTVIVRVVHHPGTKPTYFMTRALRAKREFVTSLLKQYVLQANQLQDEG